MTAIGYARVSSLDQCLDGQSESLRAAGCTRIFAEKVSGKSTKTRDQLKALLADLMPGDVVIVTRLDRLARSAQDLLNILGAIEDKGAQFKSLADAWCDTSSPHGRLMITILGALAEFERALILERTAAGMKRAREQGVKFGRRYKLDQPAVTAALARVAAGEPVRDVAKDIGLHWKTLERKRKAA